MRWGIIRERRALCDLAVYLENGHRDYYWGRYGTSRGRRDFDRRVDDYQQLYHAAVKHTELGPEGVSYYSPSGPWT